MSSSPCDRTALGEPAGDVISTNTDLNATGQYFWEAFPAGSGPADRTTYLFTYIDADPRRCRGILLQQTNKLGASPCLGYVHTGCVCFLSPIILSGNCTF